MLSETAQIDQTDLYCNQSSVFEEQRVRKHLRHITKVSHFIHFLTFLTLRKNDD